MEVAFGGFVEDGLGEGRGSFGSGSADGPEDNVELRRGDRGYEAGRFGEAAMKFDGGGVAGFEALREGSAGDVRE